MDEIFEIRIWDKDENETYVMLPTSKYDVMDAMEQARIGEDYSVQVTDSDYIPELCKFEFKKRILSLDTYEIDTSIRFWSEYASKLFSKMLPPEFDRTLLRFIESNYLSQEIAERNGVTFTPYGVLSAEGRGVYYMPTQENEQEETENFKIKM